MTPIQSASEPQAVVSALPLTAHRRSGAATIAFAWAAMLVSYLPFSALNGALSDVSADAHAGAADLQWVADAFTVSLVAAILAGGWLGDRIGRRRTALVGLALTLSCSLIGLTAGVLATARADSSSAAIPLLWLGQAIGGIGAGLVMSATLPLIALTASTRAVRDRAITVWAAANVVGLGGGPFLTSLATRISDWPALFVPTGVLAVASLAFGVHYACEAGVPSRPQADLPGLATAVGGTGLLVFGAIRGGSDGWIDPVALTSLIGAVVLLTAFLALELRNRHAIIDPRLFRSGAFSAAGIAAAVALFTMVGLVFVVSISLGRDGVGPTGTALRLGCLFAGNAMASIATGPLLGRLPAPTILVGGLLVAAGGATTLLYLDNLASPSELLWRLTIIGIGCGSTIATAAAMAVRSVPPELSGPAGIASNALRQIGGALGTAVLGAVFAAALGTDVASAGPAALAAGVHAAAKVLVAATAITSAVSTVLMATTTRSIR